MAVLLADVHGYRDRESAATLGISLASFKLLLHQARARLRSVAGGACTLLEHGRARSFQTVPAALGGNGGAGADAACANGCSAVNCRLGIKCCRETPRLRSLRQGLLQALSDCLPDSKGWSC